MRARHVTVRRLIRLAMTYRAEREQVRRERDEWRSRIAHYCGQHPLSSDFEGARD